MSEFQRRVLAIPECYDVFLGGGRGGAKSHTFALIALRHAEQYQDRARILYLRQSYKGLADFEAMCRDLFGLIYGTRIRYNGAEHIFRFPDGGYLELGQLEGAADYGKYQGHSYTLLEVDEAAQYADPAIIDKLRSNLRGPKDMPIRQLTAANPCDVGMRGSPSVTFSRGRRGIRSSRKKVSANGFIRRALTSITLSSSKPNINRSLNYPAQAIRNCCVRG